MKNNDVIILGLVLLGCLGLAACEGGSPAPASDPADAVSESTTPESIATAIPQTDAGTVAGTDDSGREPNDEVAIPVLPPSSMDPNDPAALPSPVLIPAKPDLRTGDMTTDGDPGDEARIMEGTAEGAATLPTRYEVDSENRMLREDRPAPVAGPRYEARPVAGYAASL
ncbi:MAG TPA: hypothetical protein VLJ37_08055 [bacterium]|nr:hypothetical protein [bacterium]